MNENAPEKDKNVPSAESEIAIYPIIVEGKMKNDQIVTVEHKGNPERIKIEVKDGECFIIPLQENEKTTEKTTKSNQGSKVTRKDIDFDSRDIG